MPVVIVSALIIFYFLCGVIMVSRISTTKKDLPENVVVLLGAFFFWPGALALFCWTDDKEN